MRIWLTALLLAMVALAGCFEGDRDDNDVVDQDDPGGADSGIRGEGPGDGSDGTDGQTGGQTGGQTSDGDNGTAGTEHEVVIRDQQYVGGTLTIQPGDTVTWVHKDQSTKHTVTADDGSFDSGSNSADFMDEFSYNEFSHTFEEEGEFSYHCKVHPSMTGTVTVRA